jgi:hypothetical protein
MVGGEETPTVVLPERLDRQLRLGPFPSGRDALRFVTYVAIAACLAPFVPTALWLGVAVLGFASSVWKPGGESVERRLVRALSWEVRRFRREVTMGSPATLGPTHRAHLHLAGGVRAAVVRAAGVPLAYLPSAELARRYELFREVVRGLEGGFFLFATSTPIHPNPFLPGELAPVGGEREARAGYQELVELIARGRSVRRVYVVVGCADPGAPGIERLEATVGTLLERLAALGLRPLRLRDRALREAARRIGLAERAGSG